MRRGRRGVRKTVGYGFVGRWRDGTLGWALPEHVTGDSYGPPKKRPWTVGKHMELCRITVECVRDALGRPIVRVAPKADL